MSTFRATLRVMWRHRAYLLVYLIGLSAAMVALMGSMAAGGTQGGEPYAGDRPVVAVVDRDGGAGSIADGLRAYLASDCELTDVPDTERGLQDAVATNLTDLIVIIDDGYAERFAAAAASGGDMPVVRTVTSYTSGRGTLATMRVEGFLSLTRAAAVAAMRDGDASLRTLSGAVDTAVRVGGDVPDDVEVVHAEDDDTPDEGGMFAQAMKFGGYPILTSLVVTVALVVGVFDLPPTRRRIRVSPQRPWRRGAAVLAACALLGVFAVAYYAAVSLLMALAWGDGLAGLTPAALGMCLATTLCYAAMGVALGFMVGQCGASEDAANGFANVFGLLVAFTGGAWFPMSMMPEAVTTLARLLPGWWYCGAIDAATGAGGQGVDPGTWAGSTGLVALYAVTFVCLGLAVGAVRSRRAESAPAESRTRLAAG